MRRLVEGQREGKGGTHRAGGQAGRENVEGLFQASLLTCKELGRLQMLNQVSEI